jgi:hypothetical protein
MEAEPAAERRPAAARRGRQIGRFIHFHVKEEDFRCFFAREAKTWKADREMFCKLFVENENK